MIRIALYTLIVLCLSPVAAYAQVDIQDQAAEMFKKGDYFQAINLLTSSLNDPDPLVKSSANYALASHQENDIGNIDYALRLYATILKMKLPEDNPLKASAAEQVNRIISLKSKFRAEDVLLKSLQPAEIIETDRRSRQIILLKSVIEEKPDYYRLYEVYYHLGRHYLVTENYHEAYVFLTKVIELKPAVNFYLPLNIYRERAHAAWVRDSIRNVSYGVTGFLLVVTIVLFYFCKPWQWVRPGHLVKFCALIFAWFIVFGLSYNLLTADHTIPDSTVIEISAAPPLYPDSGPTSPYWHVAVNLFIYGTVGITGIFLFSLSVCGMKRRWVTVLVNCTFATVFLVSLLSIYYLQNCDQKSLFFSNEANVQGRLKGANYFVYYGMEPYILTNPKAYPDLAIDNVLDVHLRKWIETHCPFTSQ